MKEGVSQGVFMEKPSYVVLESKLHIFLLPAAREISLGFKESFSLTPKTAGQLPQSDPKGPLICCGFRNPETPRSGLCFLFCQSQFLR